MRNLLLSIILIFITSTANAGLTVWGMKAESWQESSQMEKFLYVQGLFDSLAFSDYKLNGSNISLELSIVQYVKAIDTLSADYKNSLIPTVFLLRVITLEVKGNSKGIVDAELEKYRKYFSKK